MESSWFTTMESKVKSRRPITASLGRRRTRNESMNMTIDLRSSSVNRRVGSTTPTVRTIPKEKKTASILSQWRMGKKIVRPKDLA